MKNGEGTARGIENMLQKSGRERDGRFILSYKSLEMPVFLA